MRIKWDRTKLKQRQQNAKQGDATCAEDKSCITNMENSSRYRNQRGNMTSLKAWKQVKTTSFLFCFLAEN